MITLNKSISRKTREAFFHYGPDQDRPFVATLAPGDVLTLRPLRCRREQAVITIKLVDVYRYALQCRVRMTRLELANAAKKKKSEARLRRAENRATKRLFA